MVQVKGQACDKLSGGVADALILERGNTFPPATQELWDGGKNNLDLKYQVI